MMNYKLTVTKTNNGYILKGIDLDEVVEERRGSSDDRFSGIDGMEHDEAEEKYALSVLLWRVADYFGFQYSKHNEYNLKIDWEKNETEK